MPPPAVYAAGQVDPFPQITTASLEAQSRLFYVTDRRPATEGDKPAHYANDRGYVLRGGIVDVVADPPFSGWEELRAISLSEEVSERRVLKIKSTQEIGILPISETSLRPHAPKNTNSTQAGRAFARAIDEKLAASHQKDIFIYVPGYNVDFDNPVLVSKELQHYLGYRGAFITYAWPTTPNLFAYFKDLETADATRRNLRELIVYLSKNTRAENIHVIGYSAGSRLAFEAIYDLALQHSNERGEAPRMGKLIMIGSDVDRSYFAQAIADGLLDMADEVNVYMSDSDVALRASSILLGENRLGQIFRDDQIDLNVEQRINEFQNLHLIDVTEAAGATLGNGHWYFRSSPWASSDMFVSLMFDIPPAERGLVRSEGRAVWQFPPDYPDRIVRAAAQRQH